jgi:hypothetical protein
MVQPVLETGLAEARVTAGDECPLAQFGAVVGCVGISDHLAPVMTGIKRSADELAETELSSA